MEKRQYKKRSMWGPRSEGLLLELWAEKIRDLRSARKNGHVYEEMSSILETHGVCMSGKEINSKLQNLSTKYRAEKSNNVGVSGGSPSKWEYYERVHQILGSFKINNVESHVEDSLMCSQTESESKSMQSASTANSPLPLLSPKVAESSACTTSPLPASKSTEKGKNVQQKILKQIQCVDERIDQQHREMLNIAQEMAETDKRNSSLLEEFVTSTVKMNNAFIKYLKKRDD